MKASNVAMQDLTPGIRGFEYLNQRGWRYKFEIDDSLLCPTDIRVGRLDPSGARSEFGWWYTVDEHVVARICASAWLRVG